MRRFAREQADSLQHARLARERPRGKTAGEVGGKGNDNRAVPARRAVVTRRWRGRLVVVSEALRGKGRLRTLVETMTLRLGV